MNALVISGSIFAVMMMSQLGRRRKTVGDDGERWAPRQLPDGLTAREGEVLAIVAAGRSNREIAAALFVSEATVKTHINNIFAKVGARDRAKAVHYAFTHGLV